MCMHTCVLSERNLVTFAKARPAQMIFITTSSLYVYIWYSLWLIDSGNTLPSMFASVSVICEFSILKSLYFMSSYAYFPISSCQYSYIYYSIILLCFSKLCEIYIATQIVFQSLISHYTTVHKSQAVRLEYLHYL